MKQEGNLVADDYLKSLDGGSSYGAGNCYLALLGTPTLPCGNCSLGPLLYFRQHLQRR